MNATFPDSPPDAVVAIFEDAMPPAVTTADAGEAATAKSGPEAPIELAGPPASIRRAMTGAAARLRIITHPALGPRRRGWYRLAAAASVAAFVVGVHRGPRAYARNPEASS